MIMDFADKTVRTDNAPEKTTHTRMARDQSRERKSLFFNRSDPIHPLIRMRRPPEPAPTVMQRL
jgi:hypothetical protein